MDVKHRAGGHFHAVRFYDSETSLCRIVATFLREGLALGQPAIIIATPEHSRGIVAELRARELDVNALSAAEFRVLLDAETTMREFMVDGKPDARRFAEIAERALERARAGRKQIMIRPYGEMVDVLWRRGHDLAAIQLEMLWNRLARSENFSLLCGYAMGNFYKDAAVKDVCRQHTHLFQSDGSARVSDVDTLLVGSLPDLGAPR